MNKKGFRNCCAEFLSDQRKLQPWLIKISSFFCRLWRQSGINIVFDPDSLESRTSVVNAWQQVCMATRTITMQLIFGLFSKFINKHINDGEGLIRKKKNRPQSIILWLQHLSNTYIWPTSSTRIQECNFTSGQTGLKLRLQQRTEWRVCQVSLWAGSARCSRARANLILYLLIEAMIS